VIFYYIGAAVYGFWGGVGTLAIVGIIGMFFQVPVFKFIEKIYKKEKYSTLDAFKSK